MGEAKRRRLAGDMQNGPKRKNPSKVEQKRMMRDMTDQLIFPWRPGMFPFLSMVAKLNREREYSKQMNEEHGPKASESTEPHSAAEAAKGL